MQNRHNIEQDNPTPPPPTHPEHLCVFNAMEYKNFLSYLLICSMFKDNNSSCAECLYMSFSNRKKIRYLNGTFKKIRNCSEKDAKSIVFT